MIVILMFSYLVYGLALLVGSGVAVSKARSLCTSLMLFGVCLITLGFMYDFSRVCFGGPSAHTVTATLDFLRVGAHLLFGIGFVGFTLAEK
jgi:hypothetical protein